VAEHLATLAGAVAAAPERPLREFSVLTPEQHAEQVVRWNDTARQFPSQQRLHDGFEARALERPGALALVFEQRQMTFGEVERGANRIAHALQARGVKPGERVGLYVQRGFELVLALLGLAKSGAAYVPLDTAYPEDRVHFMLQDAGCRIVLCSADLVERVAAPGRVVLDVAGPEVRRASDDAARCARPGPRSTVIRSIRPAARATERGRADAPRGDQHHRLGQPNAGRRPAGSAAVCDLPQFRSVGVRRLRRSRGGRERGDRVGGAARRSRGARAPPARTRDHDLGLGATGAGAPGPLPG
jgi:hypothetical protein